MLLLGFEATYEKLSMDLLCYFCCSILDGAVFFKHSINFDEINLYLYELEEDWFVFGCLSIIASNPQDHFIETVLPHDIFSSIWHMSVRNLQLRVLKSIQFA